MFRKAANGRGVRSPSDSVESIQRRSEATLSVSLLISRRSGIPSSLVDGWEGVPYVEGDRCCLFHLPRGAKTDQFVVPGERCASASINMSVFATPLDQAAWQTKPSWAVIATEDRAFDLAMLRHMAKRIGATITEVAASHAVFMTQPTRSTALRKVRLSP